MLKNEEGEIVLADTIFTYDRKGKRKRRGFFLDTYLKANIDNYVIKAVEKKWDAVILVTGIEGSAKSTSSFSIAKYVDPTFPGELLNEETTHRSCDRIVFTAEQFLKAVDTSTVGQAIVWDEAVLGFMAGDASTEIQKMLVKKMVTIRKKRLFIFIVIPSIFLLRMYMAVFRTRACIHFYSPDGLARGFFKFYSYDSKRQLYIRGKKEFNQNAQKADFRGRTTNTEGLFFNLKEYDDKKTAAIREITEKPKKEKEEQKEELSITNLKYKVQRNRLIAGEHNLLCLKDPQWTAKDTAKLFTTKYQLTLTPATIGKIVEQDKKQQIEELKDDELSKKLQEKVYQISEKLSSTEE